MFLLLVQYPFETRPKNLRSKPVVDQKGINEGEESKVAEKMKEELSGALSMLIGLIVEALLKFFNWALGLFGYGMDNLEETIAKTKRTLTYMVKHPIDFMGGLFRAVGQGFNQFGANIQRHLLQGLVSWLTGGMRDEPIRLPQQWDLKGTIFFIMEVMGLSWASIRTKLVKHVGEKLITCKGFPQERKLRSQIKFPQHN